MLMALKLIISIVVSYLIGSFPTAYILGRLLKAIDIRQHGSGNVGATNVFRVLGKTAGIFVLIVDIIKGVIATVLIADFFGLKEDSLRVIIGISAVAGHNWTVFLNLKGGKGVATSVGVLLGLAVKIPALRLIFILTVGTWILTLLISGFVSLSSVLASFFLPIFMLLFNQSIEFILLGVVFCLFIIWRHRPNIKRLLAKEESQLNFCLFRRKRFPK